jgi:hypothetical protein
MAVMPGEFAPVRPAGSSSDEGIRALVAAAREAASAVRRVVEGGGDLAAASGGATSGVSVPAAVRDVAARFGLSPFEANLLVLCAGVEVLPELAALCGQAHGVGGPALPTFALALAAWPGGHWSAIGPQGPLRRWRPIEIGPGDLLSASPLRLG